jgi:hypothetical protein
MLSIILATPTFSAVLNMKLPDSGKVFYGQQQWQKWDIDGRLEMVG